MFIWSFAALGFLIGNLTGLTADSVVAEVLPLIFAFAGGSIIILIEKTTEEGRKLIGGALCALSVSFLIGLYASIAVAEFQILSPSSYGRTSIEERKYLRSGDVDKLRNTISQVNNGLLSKERAYDEIIEIIQNE